MPQEMHPLEIFNFRRLQTHFGSALLNKLLPRGCLLDGRESMKSRTKCESCGLGLPRFGSSPLLSVARS